MNARLRICSMADISDAVSACFGTDGLVLTESELSAEFFDLRTGLAGELFQKFTNYHLRLALVVANPANHGDRISELAHEHRRHSLIRFFSTREEAEQWVGNAQ